MLFRYFFYDVMRFKRNFVEGGKMKHEHRLTKITALYHVLEKGLSFRDSRLLFGKDKVTSLVREMKDYLQEGGDARAIQWQSALKVLDAYVLQHVHSEAKNDSFIESLNKDLSDLKKYLNGDAGGGTVECLRESIQSQAQGDFPEMALSRYSVRHFSDEPVPSEIIDHAVIWAQKSPSVCNRQGNRVHALRDRTLINEILTLHGGTRGFMEQINVLLIVTGDLRIFLAPAERNQVYLDSGLFSMSLLYGLHYQGVGACPLHWCVSPGKDMALRKLGDIPDEETITTLIGVGSLPESFKVAHSQRRKSEDVLTWH